MNSNDQAIVDHCIFREALDAYIVLDPEELTVVAVNPAAQRLTGKARRELLGMSLAALLDVDTESLNIFAQACRSTPRAVKNRRCRIKIAAAPERFVQVTASRIHTESGPFALLTLRDVSKEKQLEDELRAAKGLYQSLIETLPIYVFRKDAEGRFTFVNQAFCTLLGRSEEEILGATDEDFYPPELARQYRQDDIRVMETGQTLIKEEENQLPDGTRLFVRVIKSPVRDIEGKIVGVQGLFHDVTEERQQALWKETERRVFEMLVGGEKLSDILDELNRGFECAFPPAICSLLTYDSESGTLHHASAPSLPESYIRAIDGVSVGPRVGSCGTAAYLGKPVIVEDIETDPLWADYVDLARPHGLRACWSLPLIGVDGNVLGTFAVYYTRPRSPTRQEMECIRRAAALAALTFSRKRVERELHEHQKRLQMLLDQLPAIVWTVDRDLRFTSSAGSGLTALGLKPGQVVGQSLFEFFGTDDREYTPIAKHCIAINGQSVTFDTEWRGRYYQVRVDPVTDDESRVVGAIGIALDVTEQRKAEEEHRLLERKMQEVQRLESLGVMAGGIAHDFNNLLTSILGYAELTLLELPEDSHLRAFQQQIADAAKQAASLTERMLAYAGESQHLQGELDLNEICRRMEDLIAATISKKAKLVVELDDTLPKVEGDATQLEQVLMNFVVNASEALEGNPGTITIRTGVRHFTGDVLPNLYVNPTLPPGCYVYLSVSDTGCGMSPETQARIFDPFFSTKFTGRGLGLASTAGIVRGHGGAVLIDSVPGKGTTMTLLLPAVESRQREPSRGGQPPTTVLLVEDEPAVRAVGKEMLKSLGYDVITAASGAEAIQLYERQKGQIDVVVLDIAMPEIDGFETLKRLRQIDADVAVVIASGFGPSVLEGAGEDVGPVPVVQKPYRMDEIRHAVEAAAEDRRCKKRR